VAFSINRLDTRHNNTEETNHQDGPAFIYGLHKGEWNRRLLIHFSFSGFILIIIYEIMSFFHKMSYLFQLFLKNTAVDAISDMTGSQSRNRTSPG
jgi:hypothetical protein